MSTVKTQLVEVAAQAAAMLVCAGAVVSAGLSFSNILELRANSSLYDQIDDISNNIGLQAFATVVIPIVSSLIIPLGVVMIIISLFKINLGACRNLFVATDVVLLLFAILGYGVAGVLGAFTVKKWSDSVLKVKDLDLVRDIRTDLTATTVCALLASAACAALLVFIVVEYVKYRKHEGQIRAKFKYKNYDSL